MTTEAAAGLVGIEGVRAAAAVVDGVTVRTPLVAFGPAPASGPHLLKAESLQPTGAFKLRGAYNAVAGLAPDALARGVITYSSGNHAQGVAGDGAEIVWVGTSSDDRRDRAEALAAERGLTIIPPFDDDRIIAGQGTVGLEIAEDLPDIAAVLVPIGGGGLASGVAVAIRALAPRTRLIGVEPELAADARESLAAGRIVAWPAERVGRTIADGTRTTALGERTFPHLRTLIDDIVTVTEAEIAAAVRLCAEESRLVVEPSGALAPAALRFRAVEAGLVGLVGPVVAIVSGGNVDPERYREYLTAPIPG